jgi:hypothetical protein
MRTRISPEEILAEAVQSSLSPARLRKTPANQNRWLLRRVNKESICANKSGMKPGAGRLVAGFILGHKPLG